MRKVSVFDTTLRDGLKIAGICLTNDEKIHIAKLLVNAGVTVLEVGFPAASEDQYKSCCAIVDAIKEPVTFCVLARATNPGDFSIAKDVLSRTSKGRLHTFLPVSAMYRDHFLKRSFEDSLNIAQEAVKRAMDVAPEVEFSLVDAFRADINDVFAMTEKVLSSGAYIINYADTVGCATPWKVEALVGELKKRFGDSLRISIHCHNDLGLATANSFAALKAGAEQVHCTVNGIGERAGNTPLEELAVLIHLYGSEAGLSSSVVMNRLYPLSRVVERYTGVSLSAMKPLVGTNAFICDVTTPQLGDTTEKPPFAVITPEQIGIPRPGEPLNRDTDFDTFKKRLESIGYSLSDENYQRAYDLFKDVAGKKEYLFDEDLEVIVHQTLSQIPERYKLLYLNVSAGSIPVPHATVQLEIDGQIVQDAGFGHGPVDAAFKTIFRMVKRFPKLIRYEVNAATMGTDAQGQVLLRLQEEDTVVDGRGVNTDIVMASALALIDALNKLEAYRGKREISELSEDESWTVRL
ncbi:MAG: alpha-isopropylmalate synthase regulatory domain-containing protein [Thermodesulforhabdaceae bacterium]|jgi:2-isopropylmalate synthase